MQKFYQSPAMISRRADSRGLPIFAISVGLNTCDKASQVQHYVQSHIQINEYHDRVILVREPLQSLVNCLCPVCGKDQESTEHTCVTCAFAQTVWHLVSQWCKLPPIYAFRILSQNQVGLAIMGYNLPQPA